MNRIKIPEAGEVLGDEDGFCTECNLVVAYNPETGKCGMAHKHIPSYPCGKPLLKKVPVNYGMHGELKLQLDLQEAKKKEALLEDA